MNKRWASVLPKIILGIGLLTVYSWAGAAVPGGETISNTVTVNYQDSSGSTSYSETAQVSVTIVQTFALAWVNAQNFSGTPDSTVDPGDDVTAISTAPSVWLVNAGNTPVNANVDLADTTDPLSGTVGNDFRYTRFGNGAATVADSTTALNTTLGIAIVSTGATLSANGSGPSAAITYYSATTELAVDDLVTIGGGTTVYEVHSIPTSTTLTLRDYGSTSGSPTFAGATVSQFDAIAETVYVELTGSFGTFTGSSGSGSTYTTTKTETDSSFQGTLSATSTDTSPTLPADLVYDATIKGSSITISKYVRNINGATCTTNTYVSGSNTYCSTVDDAETGDQLEYLVVVKNANTAAIGDADLVLKTVSVTDVAPTTYTSFNTATETGAVSPVATGGANCDITTAPIWNVANANGDTSGLETWAVDSARTNKGQVSESSGTITAYLGNSATHTAGGSLSPNESQCFSFTATIL